MKYYTLRGGKTEFNTAEEVAEHIVTYGKMPVYKSHGKGLNCDANLTIFGTDGQVYGHPVLAGEYPIMKTLGIPLEDEYKPKYTALLLCPTTEKFIHTYGLGGLRVLKGKLFDTVELYFDGQCYARLTPNGVEFTKIRTRNYNDDLDRLREEVILEEAHYLVRKNVMIITNGDLVVATPEIIEAVLSDHYGKAVLTYGVAECVVRRGGIGYMVDHIMFSSRRTFSASTAEEIYRNIQGMGEVY